MTDTSTHQADGMFGAAHHQFATQQTHIRKPYEVTPLAGSVRRECVEIVHVRDRVLRNGDKRPVYRLEKREKIAPAGFMVRFPAGHSLRIETEEEMARLGFTMEPGLVNMLTGDIIIPNHEKMSSQIDLMTHLPTSYIPAEKVEAAKAAQPKTTTLSLNSGSHAEGGKK